MCSSVDLHTNFHVIKSRTKYTLEQYFKQYLLRSSTLNYDFANVTTVAVI